MDKSRLSESDICEKFIRPAMERAGWHGMDQIYREYPLRAGRVVVRGRRAVSLAELIRLRNIQICRERLGDD